MKRILTIGLDLASDDTAYEDFESKASLLDWDIVLIKPDISGFISYSDPFQGKPCLSDESSFKLKECCEHWRREILGAFEAGKTVIVFLSALQDVFVGTGERRYEGSGRTATTRRIVSQYSNYNVIPFDLMPVVATGTSMKLSARGAEVLAPYWAEFETVSKYEVLLTNEKVPACIVTKAGNKSVGAMYRSKSSSGTLLILPDIEFFHESFLKGKGEEQKWTAAAEKFAGKMISAIVGIDKALHAGIEITPEPAWATDSKFTLGPESVLRAQLLDAEQRVEEAQKRKEHLAGELKAAGAYRGLLFEKGGALENVIIEALRAMGFAATRYKDSDSEFDVVFESDEGRLIGEAEGKDNKAVNIDKLRQLSMNIHEDLQRETITKPAKPVLFGNGFRLQPLGKRADPFTEKCESAAATSSTALVFTADLFWPVQYLIVNSDPEYARACRQVLLSTTGRVVFPPPPSVVQTPDEAPVEKAK